MKNRIKYRSKCVLLVQKIVRGYLCRKQHQPRYRGIMQIRSVSENVRKTADIANQLKSSKEIFLKQVAEIEHLIDTSVQKIRVRNFTGLF